MKKYFITGGFGFLGQYIVKAIHEHEPEADLCVLVRTKRKTLLGIESLERVRLIRGDLLDPETYATELDGVDTIVHNGAMVSFRRSDADAIYTNPMWSARETSSELLRTQDAKIFIFISSVSAVGVKPHQVSNEQVYPDIETKRQKDMYGYSKLVSENELRALKGKMRVIILNPSVVLGPGSARIEAIFRLARFSPFMPVLPYVNNFVDVRDVAEAVLLSLGSGRSGERYIVSAHQVDMLEFTKMTMSAMGRKPLFVRVSGIGLQLLDTVLWVLDLLKLNPGIRRPSEMSVDKIYSAEKIHRELGWQPAYSLEQSIADLVQSKKIRY